MFFTRLEPPVDGRGRVEPRTDHRQTHQSAHDLEVGRFRLAGRHVRGERFESCGGTSVAQGDRRLSLTVSAPSGDRIESENGATYARVCRFAACEQTIIAHAHTHTHVYRSVGTQRSPCVHVFIRTEIDFLYLTRRAAQRYRGTRRTAH